MSCTGARRVNGGSLAFVFLIHTCHRVTPDRRRKRPYPPAQIGHRRTPARIEVEQTPVRPQTPPRKSRARCNDATYRFECGEQPPPRGRGSTDRAVRQRATHRSNVRWSTSNSAASCAYEPAPRSYAITARYPQRPRHTDSAWRHSSTLPSAMQVGSGIKFPPWESNLPFFMEIISPLFSTIGSDFLEVRSPSTRELRRQFTPADRLRAFFASA